MKKSILNLGKALNKAEQKTINGGKWQCLLADNTCIRYSFGCAESQCLPGL